VAWNQRDHFTGQEELADVGFSTASAAAAPRPPDKMKIRCATKRAELHKYGRPVRLHEPERERNVLIPGRLGIKMVRRQQHGGGDWDSPDHCGNARPGLAGRARRLGIVRGRVQGDLAAGCLERTIIVRHAIGSPGPLAPKAPRWALRSARVLPSRWRCAASASRFLAYSLNGRECSRGPAALSRFRRNGTIMPFIDAKAAAPATKIAATSEATSMLAFGELSAIMTTLLQRVTSPAFCQAFTRRLARCRGPPAAELGRRQVGEPARARAVLVSRIGP
jgi:hypothetical protein